MMFTDRKSCYKLPPTTIRDKLISQETRRNKALEDQKRRRAQRIDSARQLDLFSGLNLGGSDDEDDGEDESPVSLNFSAASVAQYAPLLANTHGKEVQTTTTSSEYSISSVTPLGVDFSETPQSGSKKKLKKRKKRRTNKPSKWADKCMYAELLEMMSDDPWSGGVPPHDGIVYNDGLPKDLETGWVAIAPVPAGKRCLAVTHQSAGVAGIVPNTTLRSRLLGKTLIQRFPSSLPPLTVLDCILDANWRDNGILHVLDVVRWKGQDVGDCEAGFRFWWRDTRLAELTQTLPPSTSTHSNFVPSTPSSHQPSDHASHALSQSLKYRFPYPTTFVSVPYYTDTTLGSLDAVVIPAARSVREVLVMVPLVPTPAPLVAGEDKGMEVELLPCAPPGLPTTSSFAFQAPHVDLASSPTNSSSTNSSSITLPQNFRVSQPQTSKAYVQPDGLLLYVAEASYEHGTSPLSSWVPISAYDHKDYEPDESVGAEDLNQRGTNKLVEEEGLLGCFHGLVRRRLMLQMGTPGLSMCSNEDVEMRLDAQ